MASLTTTLSDDRISPLNSEERAATGFSHRFRILYTDVGLSTATGATDDVTVTLGSTPTKWVVDKAALNITTAFAGTTAMTATVGVTGSVAAAVASTSVLSAGFKPMVSTVPISTNLHGTSSTSLVAVFTNATGGSPSALTAGEAVLLLNIQDAATL